MPVKLIRRILLLQLAMGAGGGGLWYLLRGADWAVAALAGGLISAFLTLYTALRFFLRARNAPLGAVTGALYRAEAMKFLMAAVLLSAATYFFGAAAIALVTTFAATLTAYWFALLWPNS